MCCRLQAVRSRICAHITVNAPRIQVNTGTEHCSLAVVNCTGNGFYARQNAVFHDQLRNLHLADRQMIGISRTSRIDWLYARLSACARSECTAGPFDLFSIFD